MGRPGFTLGIGPSHAPVIEGMYGMSYDTAGAPHRGVRHASSPALLHGEAVDVAGRRADAARRGGRSRSPSRCSCSWPPSRRACCVSPVRSPTARSCGWATPGRSSRTSRRASARQPPTPGARRRGSSPACPSPCTTTSPRPAPSPPGSSRSTASSRTTSGSSPTAASTTRPTRRSSATRPRSRPQLQGLLDAGATDIWAAIFPVGDDASGSRRRTRALLQELATS